MRVFVVVLFSYLSFSCTPDRDGTNYVDPRNSFQTITGGDASDERAFWNAKLRTQKFIFGREPISFLKENINLLPKGKALVLPMEEGRNAVFLAQKGYLVEGIDFSEEALMKAKRLAKEAGVKVKGINADLNWYNLKEVAYDVVVAAEFFRPRLVNEIKQSLKKNGVVLYETYLEEHVKNLKGRTARRDFLLKRGELKELFKDYKILVYRESNDGKRAVASIVAQKPG